MPTLDQDIRVRCQFCRAPIFKHVVYGVWMGWETMLHACPASHTGHQPSETVTDAMRQQEIVELERLFSLEEPNDAAHL